MKMIRCDDRFVQTLSGKRKHGFSLGTFRALIWGCLINIGRIFAIPRLRPSNKLKKMIEVG